MEYVDNPLSKIMVAADISQRYYYLLSLRILLVWLKVGHFWQFLSVSER